MAPRRSTRLHPQIHASEQGARVARRRRHPQIQASADGAGVSPRRSPRLHPQIHASEEVAAGISSRSGTSPPDAAPSLPDENTRSEQGARVACLRPQIQPSDEGAGVNPRRSPPLHPHIHASEEDVGVARLVLRCHTGTSPTAADASLSLPDDDDLLREILVRLPPHPSSLPRAAAVCKRWLALITDPKFHRQFYAHHRKPPLLGAFLSGGLQGIAFKPMLYPPDRIFRRGPVLRDDPYHSVMLDCRHGRVLLHNNRAQGALIVWDPITGEKRRVAMPGEHNKLCGINAAVLCAAGGGDPGHVHGGCHSSEFKVVLLSMNKECSQPLARVYSSETGEWGDNILTEAHCQISEEPAVLVGNCLYWLSMGDDILEFDLGEHRLNVLRGPAVQSCQIIRDEDDALVRSRQIIRVEDGAVGYIALSYPLFEMWQRNINGHGAATWEMREAIELDTILPLLPSTLQIIDVQVLGYDEDDALFLCFDKSVYKVQLKSMQFRKLDEIHSAGIPYFPFKSFFTPGIAGALNSAKMLQTG